MSSWAKSSGAGRRPQSNPNGSAQPLRSFRRAAPYPSREDRAEERKDALDSYEELDQKHSYSGNVKYEGYKHQQNAKPEGCSPADRRKALYQKFYRQVQEERKPADCVVLSVTSQCIWWKYKGVALLNSYLNDQKWSKCIKMGGASGYLWDCGARHGVNGARDYPKSLGQCLQERGLSVEMLYLQAESGLTRALQDVRADGSPLCILVEQTNVALSSCTVIIFSESLKIHRNMPKDQAMDFVTAEYGRGLVKERPPRDPSDIAARASQLLDDFLDREKIERHAVPSDTRQLLLLLAEGVHLYSEELGTISEYLRSRQDHLQASTTEGERGSMLPPGLGKPPPLLPTPPGPPQPQPGPGAGGLLPGPLGDHPPLQPTPLLPSPGSYPKTKPPPLLSLHRAPGPSLGAPTQRGPSPPRGPPSSHSPYGALPPRGPPHHHPLPYHPGPRGPHGGRGTPPSLKSVRTPLLSVPGGPPPRPSGPRR